MSGTHQLSRLDTVLFGDIVYKDGTKVPLGVPLPGDGCSVRPRSPGEMPRRQEYLGQAHDRLLWLTRDLIWGFRGGFISFFFILAEDC